MTKECVETLPNRKFVLDTFYTFISYDCRVFEFTILE